MNAREYAEQLAQAAGLSDDEKTNFMKVVANDKAAKFLEDSTMLRSDYSRQSDALTAEKKKTQDYYASLTSWQADEQQKINNFWDQYQQRPNGNATSYVNNGNADYVTKKDVEALNKTFQDELQRRENVQIQLLKDGMKLASSHVHEFHEPLDVDALEKIAIDKKLTLRAAYEDMVGSRRTEAQTKSFEARLAQAREEGAREFASKHRIPTDSQPREYHAILDRDPSKQITDGYVPNSGHVTPLMERKLRDNFVEAWDSAASSNTSER